MSFLVLSFIPQKALMLYTRKSNIGVTLDAMAYITLCSATWPEHVKHICIRTYEAYNLFKKMIENGMALDIIS